MEKEGGGGWGGKVKQMGKRKRSGSREGARVLFSYFYRAEAGVWPFFFLFSLVFLFPLCFVQSFFSFSFIGLSTVHYVSLFAFIQAPGGDFSFGM